MLNIKPHLGEIFRRPSPFRDHSQPLSGPFSAVCTETKEAWVENLLKFRKFQTPAFYRLQINQKVKILHVFCAILNSLLTGQACRQINIHYTPRQGNQLNTKTKIRGNIKYCISFIITFIKLNMSLQIFQCVFNCIIISITHFTISTLEHKMS